MSGIILHHYAASPYSEKIRAIFGYKQLTWKSVQIPMVMPKPDLVALTGGYRKTPVLQIGADIYCDTKLIARVLDRLQPPPMLIPHARAASCAIYEQWSERFFLMCSLIPFAPPGHAHLLGDPGLSMETLVNDRIGLFAKGKGMRASRQLTQGELPGMLALLEAQLGITPFLDGSAPTLADFSVYHPVWFVLSNPGVAAYFDPYPSIRAWAQCIAAYGHGKPEEISSEDALRIARDSEPDGNYTIDPASGFKQGPFVIAATDYGGDLVRGRLVHADQHELALRREDPRAGTVVVHFPRAGFARVPPKKLAAMAGKHAAASAPSVE